MTTAKKERVRRSKFYKVVYTASKQSVSAAYLDVES